MKRCSKALKGLLFALSMLVGCAPPIEGPDVKKASDSELDLLDRDCLRFGKHGEPGAKFTAAYCRAVAEERARRVLAKRIDR